MYEEDLIFGPLTLKQGIVFVSGAIAMLAVSKYLDEYFFIAMFIIFLITAVLIVRFKPKKIGESPEDYYKKKYVTDPEFAKKHIRKKIAEISSAIHERDAKGMNPSPVLNDALEKLEQIKVTFEK